MKHTSKLLFPLLIALMAFSASANAVTVPKGTEVILTFDQALSSKTAKVGEPVALHVRDDVRVNGHTVIAAGTKVGATISEVDKRKRYGINAKMRIVLNPVRSTYGPRIDLEPSAKGHTIGGKKSGEAAAATVGGAILLGPVGLVGGLFVHGKPVNIHVGDPLVTEVSTTVMLHHHNK